MSGRPWFFSMAVFVLSTPAVSVAESLPDKALAVVAESVLAEARGGDTNVTVLTSEQRFTSTVQDASFTAGSIRSGNATIGDGAFDGFSGVGLTVLNTGNANAINAGVSMTVNLQ